MIIKMKRDYAISYKYAWLIKGNIYDSTKLPNEVKEKIPDLVKRGIAIELEDQSVKGSGVSENYRVKQLEQKKLEDAQSEDDAENRAIQAQLSSVVKPVEEKIKKTRATKKKEDLISPAAVEDNTEVSEGV